MIETLLASLIQFSFTPKPVPQSVANYCADTVGIPRNSDNFSNQEWEQFKRCIIQHQE